MTIVLNSLIVVMLLGLVWIGLVTIKDTIKNIVNKWIDERINERINELGE